MIGPSDPEHLAGRLAAIVDSCEDAVVGKTLDGVVESWNPAAERLFGHTAREAVGRHISFLFPEGRKDEEARVLERVGRGERVDCYDTVRRRKDGTFVDVSVSVSPVRDARGCVVGASTVARDVTRRREADAALRRAVDDLRTAERFKTHLLQTLAHEVNTPLTPLKLQIHMLKSGAFGPLAPGQVRSLGILERNVDRLSDLVREILDLSRLQGDRHDIVRRPVDLSRLVEDAVQTYAEAFREAGVRLDADADAGVSVEGDAGRLMQVVVNLVSNALKFTPAGGRVRVRVRSDGVAARVEVEDDGAGFDPGQASRLFQPFGRLGTPMREGATGTGLGLYICRGVVELHGGRMSATSPGPGRGATFGFEVPLAPAALGREAS